MPSNYLNRIPRLLLEEFKSGRWLPIVGAGLSANAETVSGKRPPLWGKLGDDAKDYLPSGYGSNGPVDALSSFEQTYNRASLIDWIREALLVDDAIPGRANLAFAGIPFDVVITTNLDFLLEQAWSSSRRPYEPVIGEQRLVNRRRVNATQLVKFHGDVNHPNELVVTEDDYDRFLLRFPVLATYVSSLLITRVPIFIGYSLEDPDFRSILTSLSTRLGANGPSPWVLLPRATDADVARFQRRGVKTLVLETRGNVDRGEVLARFFDQLAALMRESGAARAESLNDSLLSELRLPENDASQLVLFLGDSEHLAMLRENLFDELEAAGLVPTTVGDLRSAPELALAAQAQLIRRSAAVVVDIRSGRPVAGMDLGLVSSILPPNKIVVLSDAANSQSAFLAGNSFHFVLVDDGMEVPVPLLLDAVLSATALHQRTDVPEQILNRLTSGDTTFAFLQAVVELEARLRRNQVVSKTSFRRLLHENPMIGERDSAMLQAAYALRSEYLHRGIQPPQETAENLTRQLIDVIRRLG